MTGHTDKKIRQRWCDLLPFQVTVLYVRWKGHAILYFQLWAGEVPHQTLCRHAALERQNCINMNVTLLLVSKLDDS